RRNKNRVNAPTPGSFCTRFRLKIQTIDKYCTSWNTSNRAMPARRFITNTFAYQKKPKLVAISSSLIELTGRPRCHIHAVWQKNAIVTAPVRARIAIESAGTARDRRTPASSRADDVRWRRTTRQTATGRRPSIASERREKAG